MNAARADASAEMVRAIRAGAGIFRRPDLGLLEVAGGDRRRWLQGMLSNDVEALEPAPGASGCAAALLNHRAGVIAALQVVCRPEVFWLEGELRALEAARTRMQAFIVADDVEVRDPSPEIAVLGLEGPKAGEWLAGAFGVEAPERDEVVRALFGAGEVVIAGWGSAGAGGFRLYCERAVVDAVVAALRGAAAPEAWIEGDPGAREILRIEAGLPAAGSELGEDCLPDEARLEHTISETKGCYTGQEIVARLRSRGRVNHRLVGLRFADGDTTEVGGALYAMPSAAADEAKPGDRGKRIGEVTSRCTSPDFGAIGLGFVRRECAEPETPLATASGVAEVAELPFFEGASRSPRG